MYPGFVLVPLFCSWMSTTHAAFKAFAPTHRMFSYPGDIVLAAFMPVHQNGFREGTSSSTCGKLQEQDGIQFIEILYNTLDTINNDPNILPGTTLGAIVFDTCNNEKFALEHAVGLIRFLITREDELVPFECSDGSVPYLLPSFEAFHSIVGVIGGAASGVSLHLASLLRLFEVPQISHMSTSSELTNQERFPFFKRTVPSDANQARAIVDLLKAFNWTYVSVIYDDTYYGSRGFDDLSRIATEENVCFAYSAQVLFDDSNWNEDDYDRVVDEMTQYTNINVVVVYTDLPQARQLFEAIHRKTDAPELIYVGSDAWSGRSALTSGLETIVNRAITVQPLAYVIPEFDTYFKSLKPANNSRNPWFKEFWENHFNCTFEEETPERDLPPGGRCTGEEVVSKETGYEQLPSLHFMHDAVYAFATVLSQLERDKCGTGQSCLTAKNLTGKDIMEYLNKVEFQGLSGKEFSFVNGTDGPPRYSIRRFGRNEEDEYLWSTVGTYSGISGEKELTFEQDFYDEVMEQYPKSRCSDQCQHGQIKQYSSGDICCWVCVDCSEHEIIGVDEGREICSECGEGLTADSNKTQCVPIEETFVTFMDYWSLAALAFSGLGLICTAFVFVIFLVFFDTPVVKASGREICLTHLAGIALSCCTTVVLVAPPSPILCGFIRVLVGVCYTICYAAILTKTNRIARIFTETTQVSPRKTKFTSPHAQLVIIFIMVCVELVVISVWMLTSPPQVTNVFPERHLNVLVCEGAQDIRYLIPLIYPFILLIICTVYAFKTRKTPDGFNETRFIAFTSYTTCVIWLAFMPLYFIADDYTVRAFILSVALSLSALVGLACIFGPKVYICLATPEKNTREAIMARTSSACNSASFIVEQAGGHIGSNLGTGDQPKRHTAATDSGYAAHSRSYPNLSPTGVDLTTAASSTASLPVSALHPLQHCPKHVTRVVSVHGVTPASSYSGSATNFIPKDFNKSRDSRCSQPGIGTNGACGKPERGVTYVTGSSESTTV